jgi:hypothetical protein
MERESVRFMYLLLGYAILVEHSIQNCSNAALAGGDRAVKSRED